MVTRNLSARRLALGFAVASLPMVLCTAAFAQTYTGPNNGNWDTAGNWNPATVPNSAAANVTVANLATVVIPDGVSRTAGDVTISASSGINVGTNSYFYLSGSLVNAGTLTIVGDNSRLRTNGNNLDITGTGAIVLSHANSYLDGGAAINNGLGHTIRGFGNVGANGTVINNLGTISANVSGQTLTVDPANAANFNTGLMLATGGGTLAFTGNGAGAIDNTGGTIRAEANSTFRMQASASISNGSLTTTGSGTIKFNDGDNAYLTNTTTSGNLRLGAGAFLYTITSWVNNGTLTFEANAGNSRLRTNGGDLNITGTGTIDMTEGGIIDGGARVTFGSGQTIIGKGNIGANGIAITNGGVINANVSGQTLTIDPANVVSNFNTNLMLASGGGTLAFTGNGAGAIDNTGGTIRADANSTFLMQANASLLNGSLSTTGSGKIKFNDGDNAYLTNTTTSGNMRLGAEAYLHTITTWVNNGTLTFEANAGNSRLRSNGGDISVTGTGTIDMTEGGYIDGGARFTFGSGQTIIGKGNLGANGTLFTIGGLVNANVSGQAMVLDPANAANAFVNNGTLRASNGGVLQLTGNGAGDFVNNSSIEATGAGSAIEITASARVIGGTFTTSNNGAFRSADGTSTYLQNTTIAANTNLVIGSNSYTYIEGALTLNGSIGFKSTAANTNQRLRTTGGDVTINGTGVINLNNQLAANTDCVIDGGARMTFGPNITVSGSGSIGINNTLFTNNGVVESAFGGIGIDPANAANGFLNNNIIRALPGGLILLTGNGAGDFVNGANGTITASGTGVVTMTASARIVGGTLTTTSGGTFDSAENQSVYLRNVTITPGSTFTVGRNSYTYLEESITNNGTITFKTDAATNQRLRTTGNDVLINGTGQIVLNNNTFAGSDMAIDGGARITLGSGQVVRGSGSLGYNNTVFTNNGIVESAIGGISIDPANAPNAFLNNNIVRALSGGSIILTGNGAGDFVNTNGTISATGTGVVEMTSSARIIGGTLTTTSGGTFRSAVSQSVYLQNATLSTGSSFTINQGSFVYLEGSITNNGTITYATTAATNQRLRTNGSDVSINGTGFIVLNNQSVAGSDMAIDGGGRVTLGAGQTVQGSGSLGYNNTLFTNNGVIESSIGGIGIDPANAADAFVNNGTLRANTGGNLTFTGNGAGSFSGAGPLVTNGTGSLLFTSSANANMGNVTGTGALNVDNSSNATFTSFRVGSNSVSSSGTLRIAAGGGNNGTSKTSSLAVATNGRVDVTDHALIVEYTGNTVADAIRGYLASGRQANGAWQGPGISSSLASNGNGKGVGYLEASQKFGVNGGNFYGQQTDGTAVLVAYTLNGDTDLDRDVDFNDLLRVAQSYGATTTGTWFTGDFTYNGAVDFNDLLPLAQNYGHLLLLSESEEAAILNVTDSGFMSDWSTASAMVPEPTVLGLLAGVTTLALRRRK